MKISLPENDLTKLEDVKLLQFVLKKDEKAFAEIYERYWKLLYTTALNIIQDEGFAKDAVQEVFIALWHKKEDANILNPKAYLQQAVRFQVLKVIRNKKADTQFYNCIALITADIIYDDPLLFKEQQALIKEIMESLPDDCKTIFNLSREEQLTYKQISEKLNISQKTVEKKMSICLQHFRHYLALNKAVTIAVVVFLGFYG